MIHRIRNKISIWVLVLCLLASVVGGSGAIAAGTTASDVKGHWAEAVFDRWADQGFIHGYSDGSFRPDQPITRAEFVALINRSFGFTAEEPIAYADVSVHSWHYKEIAKAHKAGYVTGFSDGTFRPDRSISRQEVAAIAARLLALEPAPEAADRYPDSKLGPAWSKGAIGAVVEKGLMKGFSDGSFRPLAAASRAEAIVTLDRALSLSLSLEAETPEPSQENGNEQPGSPSQGGGSGGGNPATPSPEELLVGRLLDDPWLKAERGTKPDTVQDPLDEAFALLHALGTPLAVGESLLTTFDGSFYDNPIRRVRESGWNNAEAFVSSDPAYNIDGTAALVIDSRSGNYTGAYLEGPKFASGGRYKVEFDYKIVEASNDFFFLFRANSDASGDGDRFVRLPGNTGDTGKVEHIFELNRYYDYRILVFPGNAPGIVALDNIKITRLPSKPEAADVGIQGNPEVGNSLTGTYVYENAEDIPESGTTMRWFSALDRDGLNRTLIASGTNSIELLAEHNGKWIGFEVTPKSAVAGPEAAGLPVIVWTSAPVGGTALTPSAKVELAEGERFVETFEADEDSPKIYVLNHQSDFYISGADGETIDGRTLVFDTDGGFRGVDFGNVKFAGGGTYEISFEYKVLDKPDVLYVQLRTDTGWYSHDKFATVDLDAGTETPAVFRGTFVLDDFPDYKLMLFVKDAGGKVLLDNLTIERVQD